MQLKVHKKEARKKPIGKSMGNLMTTRGPSSTIGRARHILLFPVIPLKWKLSVFCNLQICKEIINYLENNPTAAYETPLQNFTDLPWRIYLSSMSINGTFGDHITLQAASDLCGVPSSFIYWTWVYNYYFSNGRKSAVYFYLGAFCRK